MVVIILVNLLMAYLVLSIDKVNFMNHKKTKNSNQKTTASQSPAQSSLTQNLNSAPTTGQSQADLNRVQQLQKSHRKNNRPNKKKRHARQISPRAKAVREYSSGGIVFRLKEGIVEIVLLQDLKARWSIPKGHVESGETLEQTAIREVGEETGLKSLKILSKLDKIHFFYRMNNKLIFMTNFVYLMEATDVSEPLELEVDSEGIVDVQWFEAEQAYDIVEYKATKVIIREAINRIKKYKNI